MSVAVANPDFYDSEDRSLRRYLGYSLFLHGALVALVVASIIFHFQGNFWGGVGGASEGDVKVNLVGSVGIPMPKPPDITESRTFDPTDSLYKAQPKPKPPEPPKPEVKIPDFKKEKRLPPSVKSRTYDNPTPPPDNAVPGLSGKMNFPTGSAQTQGAPAPRDNIKGQGGGDFATRYGWDIE